MRVPFLPAIHRARVLFLFFPSLVYLFTLSFFHTLLFLILHCTLLSPTHPFLPNASTTLVSSFSNFPRWRYRPLCFFLDTVKRLNATTSSLRFLPHFLSLLQGLIYRNGAICCPATQRRKREIGFWLSRVFCRICWLCTNQIRMKILKVNY